MENQMFKTVLSCLAFVLFTGLTAADKPAQTEAPKKKKKKIITIADAKSLPYPEFSENVVMKHVTVWSDGTRMAADLYKPKNIKEGEKLPAVVIINGTGGVKRKLPTRIAPYFVEQGYVFISFDYRGWGESDSRLIMTESMPEPDANGEVTVKARAVRWQLDYADQTEDVRNIISYLAGDPNVDPEKIGVYGTSFGGGLATWTAAHDSRVKCMVAQVPGMGRMRSEGSEKVAYGISVKQSRAETEVVPDKGGRLGPKTGKYYHMRYNAPKSIGYNVLAEAHKIKAPTLIIDAGKDELLNWRKNGGALAEILKKQEGVIIKHAVLPMTHYGVYGAKFDETTKLAVSWFDTHLKGKDAEK
jgi:dienelactone hydrolase